MYILEEDDHAMFRPKTDTDAPPVCDFTGSHGVAFGFIGANTSKESRTSYMALYRVVCMLGVLFATIGKSVPDLGQDYSLLQLVWLHWSKHE